ncbi:polysaccharide deacetylase family protein [Bacillus sp. FJAT-27445]|uniref:polysaccharide deacetylase family protein n=1 Tax=Bacillus sp. FJAT-27445 TaxID=1679166 RepID=UPI0007435B37|nr:polysaccharide deacetylase family protein [Bacillus sp. FJAT-27445]
MGKFVGNKKLRNVLICLAFVPLIFGVIMAAGTYGSKARVAKSSSLALTWLKAELKAEFPNYGTRLQPVKPVSQQHKPESTKNSQNSAGLITVVEPPAKTGQEAKPAQKPTVKPSQAQKPVPKTPAKQDAPPALKPSATSAGKPATTETSKSDTTGKSNHGTDETTIPDSKPAQGSKPDSKPAETPSQSTPAAKPPAPSAPAKQRELYLTFDDGPHRVSSQILDLLDKYNAKATFFMLDGNMNQHPEAVKRMAASGHGLGMHGVSHDKAKFYQSGHTVIAEMNQGRDTVKRLTGIESILIRTPFGSSPYMTHDYKKAVIAHGFKMWDWNVDSRDWFYRDRRFVESAIEQIEKQKSKPGPIVVLLHERDETLLYLPALLDYLKNQNFKLLPLTADMEPVQFK